MPPWMYLWLLRIASGEKIEKAKPYDYRYWFGVFALTPIFIGTFAFVPFGKHILDQGSALSIWVYSCVNMFILYVLLVLWARWVPAKISLFISIGVWAVAFWVAWHLQ